MNTWRAYGRPARLSRSNRSSHVSAPTVLRGVHGATCQCCGLYTVYTSVVSRQSFACNMDMAHGFRPCNRSLYRLWLYGLRAKYLNYMYML